MFGVFAEFEREMIRDRVMAGLAVVKETGKNKMVSKLLWADPRPVPRLKSASWNFAQKGMASSKLPRLWGVACLWCSDWLRKCPYRIVYFSLR
jgi:DNA invertase Pin-like site-specific DNA recombinase